MPDMTQYKPYRLAAFAVAAILSLPALAQVERRVANNGNLLMEDVPEIPADIVSGLQRFQNVRSAGFLAFSAAGDSVFINTRFGDVGQVHRVDMPGGARRQITYSPEPVGGVTRQPGTDRLIFTRDAGRQRVRAGVSARPGRRRGGNAHGRRIPATARWSGIATADGSRGRAPGATVRRTICGLWTRMRRATPE